MKVKIKEYRVSAKGIRGLVITIPKIFATDNNIQPGDTMELYRGYIDGKDALILMPKKIKERESVKSNMAETA